MRILFLVHDHHHDQFMYLLFCAKFSKHLNINKNDFVFTLVLHFHVCLKHSDWCLTDFNENLLKSHATSLQLSITHYNSVKLKTTQNISKKLKTSQNISYHLWQNCTACKAHLKQVTSLHLVIDIMLSCWVVHQVRPVFCRGLKPLVFEVSTLRAKTPETKQGMKSAQHCDSGVSQMSANRVRVQHRIQGILSKTNWWKKTLCCWQVYLELQEHNAGFWRAVDRQGIFLKENLNKCTFGIWTT